MSRQSGKQLFDWMEQIPEEYILEAEQDSLTDEQVPSGKPLWEVKPKPKAKSHKLRLAGILKYLPVAASIALVIGGGWYLSEDFLRMGSSGNSAGMGMAVEEESKESAVLDAGQGVEATEEDMDSGDQSADNTMNRLPVRSDAYDGPILALTATGDNQKLRTVRRLACSVESQRDVQTGDVEPVLSVSDRYQIQNLSDEDKTLQLVYPYVTTLNRSYDSGEPLLTIDGQQLPLRYCVGDGIASYLGRERTTDSIAQDYEQLLAEPDDQDTYQEQALSKDADWNRQMAVYTFSDFTCENSQQSPVLGITVEGVNEDVFTYGFDYEQRKEQEASRYSLFVPDGEAGRLVLMAPVEAKLDVGYYTNLDWEGTVEGVDCKMTTKTMTLSAALRLCSAWNYRQQEDSGSQAGTAPDYTNAGVLYQALTRISEEERFYDTLIKRYHTSEMTEVFEKLMEETRIVYGLATVTIPAGDTLKVTAHVQKRQNKGNYVYLSEAYEPEEPLSCRYDVFSDVSERLGIVKTVYRLKLTEEWSLLGDDLGLEEQENGIWKAVLREENGHLVIGRSEQ